MKLISSIIQKLQGKSLIINSLQLIFVHFTNYFLLIYQDIKVFSLQFSVSSRFYAAN